MPTPGDASARPPQGDGESVIDLEIERLVAGGEGLARRPDQPVVFVRGALPGERIQARVAERRKGWERADLLAVLGASPERVSPPCPEVAAGCGGCDLQHADPAAQPGLKVATVLDGLVRLGHIDDPVVSAGPALAATGFRTTVRAAVVDGRAGFRRHHSHDVVRPETCLVAHPMVDQILIDGYFAEAHEVTIRVGAATGERMVLVAPSAQGVVVPDHPGAGAPGGSRSDGPGGVGRIGDLAVVGTDELKAGRRAWIHEVVAGRTWRISARSFFQTRPDGAAALVDAVTRATGADLDGARVVDAYSGVGLLAGSLFGGPHVPASLVAVERSPSAVADARVNLADLIDQDRLRVVRSDLDGWRQSAADVVVADPARAGLGRRAAQVLDRTGAAVLVLVSCDAASLGRDAALLTAAGFRFEGAELVDLFPMSHHVEVVSRFSR